MNVMKCPHCTDGEMSEEAYSKQVKVGRRCFDVEGLLRFACSTCGGHLVRRSQVAHNARLLDEAKNLDVVASVDVHLLRALRTKYDLTQKAASMLFGAGESSFAKWESGQSAMSTPTALLVRCAVDVPGVIEHISQLRGLQLRELHCSTVDEIAESTIRWSTAASESTLTVSLSPSQESWTRAAISRKTSVTRAFTIEPELDESAWTTAGAANSDHYETKSRPASRLAH